MYQWGKEATDKETKKMTAPKKAMFDRITETDGYKLTPANATAKKFCEAYGTNKIRMTEAMSLKIGYDNINWGAS